MEAVRENTTVKTSETTLEEQKHNAMIKERYKRLQNAEANQFAEIAEENSTVENRFEEFVAPVFNNAPAVEQMPQVTEFVPARSENPVFTTEKFERMAAKNEAAFAAAPAIQPTVVANVTAVAPAKTASVATATQYSLSTFAKVAMAVFTLIIVAMLALICVNTQTIENKRIKIKNLEEKREQLLEEYDELQLRIQEATNEDAIRQYAIDNGMINLGEI